MFSKAVFAFLLVLATTTIAEKDEFPKEDYKTFFKDFGEALGIEQILDTAGFYFRTWIRIGQAYTLKKLDNDLNELKKSLSLKNTLYFVHKMFWVGVSQSGVRTIEFLKNSQKVLLHFLKEKCNVYLGKDAALHPWNVMMEQNEQNISFLVFIYSLAISLVVIKLLSWWNFMVYLAFWFLVYSFGGPYTVFKGMLTVTAFFWYVGDFVLRFPFHTAIVIITLFLLRYVWWMLGSLFGRSTPPPVNSNDRYDGSPASNANGYNKSQGAARYRSENKDISILSSRVDGMERKTDILTDRMERLSRAMERFGENAIDDDNVLDDYIGQD